MSEHINKVELQGFYGGDITHSLSAWTSTSRDLTQEKKERIPSLLKMLAENGHHTPFEKSFLHFLVTCDTASHIHIIKHRIGVSVNGESARYKELKEDKFYLPDDWPQWIKESYLNRVKDCYTTYHNILDALTNEGFSKKRAKESARFLLPYANQTVADVSFNFRSFMHFQKLRNDEHAQVEIREIAQEMLRLVRDTGSFTESLKAFGW